MKTSLTLSLALAAVFATLLWRGQRRLDALATTARQPAVAEVGFDAEKLGRDARAIRGAEAIYPDLLAFLQRNDPDDPAGGELKARFRELPPGELKALLARLHDSPGIPPEALSGIIGEAIGQLAAEDPAGALQLFARHAGELEEGDVRISALATAIGGRAKDDPQAALAWFLENQKAQPVLSAEDVVAALFRGTAEYDPRLAFGLFEEFGAAGLEKLVPDPNDPFIERNFVTDIVATARTDAERTAVVTALREFDQPEEHSTISNAGWRGIGKGFGDFQSAALWIASAGVTQNELGILLNYVPIREEVEMASWMKFGEQELDAEGHGDFLQIALARWSDADHAAVARWLATQPTSDFARSAAAIFAEYVAAESPMIAFDRIRSLPAGPVRRAGFAELVDRFPAEFAEGAEIRRELAR